MLPMGTIMAACMLIGVLFAARLPVLSKLPRTVDIFIGLLVLAAGLWNTFWYAVRNVPEFWGVAALVSGILMIIVAGYLLAETKLPKWLVGLRPIVLVVLLGYGLMYAVTIARL